MGYSTRFGTEITDFWPDDDDTTLYLASGWLTLAELIQHAKGHFGEAVQMEDIEVSSEKIHTHCIYYDLYDAGDYTDFIVLKYKA
jgi:fumarate reductase subunit C